MSVTGSEQIREASKSLERGEVFGVGSYRLTANQSSSSLKAVIAQEFCSHHNLEDGDHIDVWIDSKTGAAIILPGDGQ